MKRTLLFSLLFSSFFCSAQLELEHAYEYTNGVQRIVLENSGEKYYAVNRQTGRIQFYNANHTPWKAVDLPLPTQNYSLVVTHISETKINADANLEIVYSTYSAPNLRQSNIINESGEVLLTVADCLRLRLDEKEGLPSKIIATNGVVYALPGLAVEHSYPLNPNKNIQRVTLESAGEKYYFLDTANGLASLYNADHTFWKNVTLPKPDGYSISSVSLLAENQLNTDNLIEVGYTCYNETQSESRIANENGVVLLTAAHAGEFVVSDIAGLVNKIMVYYMIGDLPDETSRKTDVYAVPGFDLEHTYQGYVNRVKLENSGEKYHASSYDYLTTDITIYNADHTLWKTVVTPDQDFGESLENVFISETKIDPDAALELGYTISSNTLNGGSYQGFVVKEDAAVLLEIPGAYGLALSEFPNHPMRLIAHQQDGPSFDQLYYTSSVYRLDNGFAVEDFDQAQISIAPNPTQNVVNLSSQTAIVGADIFDMRGTLISQSLATDIKTVNLENLTSGIYLLHLRNAEGLKSVHKIVVFH